MAHDPDTDGMILVNAQAVDNTQRAAKLAIELENLKEHLKTETKPIREEMKRLRNEIAELEHQTKKRLIEAGMSDAERDAAAGQARLPID